MTSSMPVRMKALVAARSRSSAVTVCSLRLSENSGLTAGFGGRA
jgi:hypothetical protein